MTIFSKDSYVCSTPAWKEGRKEGGRERREGEEGGRGGRERREGGGGRKEGRERERTRERKEKEEGGGRMKTQGKGAPVINLPADSQSPRYSCS